MGYRLSIKKGVTPLPNEDWLENLVARELLQGQTVRICRDDKGKPFVKEPLGHFVSGSDSGRYVAAVVFTRPIGVDIECRKKRAPELLIAITDAAERSQLKAHGVDALLAAWTAKESAQKADTEIHDMNDYKITLDKNDLATFKIRRGSSEWRGLWRFENDYICALAIQQ